MEAAQQRQKAYADQDRRPVEYQPGDEVLLSTENIKRIGIGTPKFMPLWIGPFKVIRRIEPTAYELELAQGMRMHDVFHVSLLKAWSSEKHGLIPIPPTLTLGEQQEFTCSRSWTTEKGTSAMLAGAGLSAEGNTLSHGEVRITVITHGSQRRICRMRARR